MNNFFFYLFIDLSKRIFKVDLWLQEPFVKYRNTWVLQLMNRFTVMVNTVERTVYDYQSYLEQEPQRLALLSQQNQTLWSLYQELQETLTLLETNMLDALDANIQALPQDDSFRLHQQRFQPLKPYVTSDCPQCSTDNNALLTEILRAAATKTSDTARSVLSVFANDLKAVYATYIEDLKIVTSQGNAEYTTFQTKTSTMLSSLQVVSNALASEIASLEAAKNLIHDLLEYTWRSYCQTELMVHLDEYHSVHIEMNALLAEVY